MELHQRTVLITGGSSGIGLALAQQLVKRGNTVIVTGRDAQHLDKAVKACPGLHTLVADMGNMDDLFKLCAVVTSRFPALDVLVNNAGVMRNLDFSKDLPAIEVDEEIITNVLGPLRLIALLLPHLRRQPNALVVNVSSGLAFVPLKTSPVYCASKAAIHSFSTSLREQLKGTAVAVVELAPPAVHTPLLVQLMGKQASKKQGMDVEQLVHKAISAIESGQPLIRPGLANVLYWMGRIAPGMMFRQLSKMAG